MTQTEQNQILVNGEPINYNAVGLIPDYMQGGLQRYIEKRIPPGSFLTAILSNDLMGAARQADDTNQRKLFDYCFWLANFAPRECYGSPERFKAWIEGKQ